MSEHAKSIIFGTAGAVVGAIAGWLVLGITDNVDKGADAAIRDIVQEEIAADKEATQAALGRSVVKVLSEHDAKHLVIDERFKNVAIALEATRDIFEAQQ